MRSFAWREERHASRKKVRRNYDEEDDDKQ